MYQLRHRTHRQYAEASIREVSSSQICDESRSRTKFQQLRYSCMSEQELKLGRKREYAFHPVDLEYGSFQ